MRRMLAQNVRIGDFVADAIVNDRIHGDVWGEVIAVSHLSRNFADLHLWQASTDRAIHWTVCIGGDGFTPDRPYVERPTP